MGPAQNIDWWDDRLFLYAHGGRGSGKSKAGAYRTLTYVNSWPGCVGIVTAPTFPMLHDATLVSLREALDEFGMVRGYHWEYVQNREEVQFRNGSLVLLRTTEHPDRLRGASTAFFWMDEPRDSPYDAFRHLKGGLRQVGYPHQAWLTSTPKGRKHWLFRVFYARHLLDDHREMLEGDQYAAYPASSLDNPFTGTAYHQSLAEEYGDQASPLYRQEVLGEHVIAEGLVYPGWRRDEHMKPVSEWPVQTRDLVQGGRVYGGIDFGFRNPSCVVVYALDSRGRRYILDGLYQPRLTEPQLIAAAMRYQKQYSVRAFACDPADPGWRVAARHAGVRVVKAINRKGSSRDTSFGIGACTAVLQPGLLWVNPALSWFADEIEEYTEEDPLREDMNLRERPKQSADHAMDAWRYAESLVNLQGGRRKGRMIPTSVQPQRELIHAR